MNQAQLLAAILARVTGQRQCAAMASVISTTGSSPQKAGARLALFEDDERLGTIGGGAVEERILELLRTALTEGNHTTCRIHLGQHLGMCCGGSMEFFVELLEPPPRLVLCGAGHIARATAQVAHTAGFVVSVVDERAELNTLERFPNCERVLLAPDEALAAGAVGLNRYDYVVICTHDHLLDQAVLARAAEASVSYLGMVASRRKAERIKARLRERYPTLSTDHLHAPTGIDLRAVDPGEIAVSITAAMIQARRASARSAPTAGMILAAGASRRLGHPKALSLLNGRSVLQNVHDVLTAGGCDLVRVVVGGPHEALIRSTHPHLAFDTVSSTHSSMGHSLLTGLRAAASCGATRCVVALLDQPRVLPETVAALLQHLDSTDAARVTPRYGQRAGHPYALRLDALELDVDGWEGTPRELLQALQRVELDVQDAAILDDLDTPRDAALLRIQLPVAGFWDPPSQATDSEAEAEADPAAAQL